MFLGSITKGLGQRGDTIVEVLIAIAIISLVLVGAYATANRNANITQDTLEHSVALKLAESQIEYLRQKPTFSGPCFLLDGSTGTTDSCKGLKPNGNDAANYNVTLTASGTAPNITYTIAVSWESIVSSQTSNVTMYYRPQ
jgi:prepilin-type N-terminal cleavage/methylation domain-containing protein